MFYGKFADEGDSSDDNPKRYNVEGDNQFSTGQQEVVARSTTSDNRVLHILVIFQSRFCNYILETANYTVDFYKNHTLE